eukprot:CAMPEP_0204595168 /NCGR_PEP_ID=MMETSP0661-20131031/52506_1 /ASSEMBLY_ACC=CAM_ASM_000606 /TAXON_ID=109239 /ORGANISM="Alexandrium margalefi, Strain AMGDE01CS-322" /LENGTH=89 /DNA_ID=CAMNT_0051605649 /DNA_START=18 /DNA_END=284 /DNA_ORIENTATION=+
MPRTGAKMALACATAEGENGGPPPSVPQLSWWPGGGRPAPRAAQARPSAPRPYAQVAPWTRVVGWTAESRFHGSAARRAGTCGRRRGLT